MQESEESFKGMVEEYLQSQEGPGKCQVNHIFHGKKLKSTKT